MGQVFKNKIAFAVLAMTIIFFLGILFHEALARATLEDVGYAYETPTTEFWFVAENVFKFSVVAAALLAVIYITIGGFMYIAAAGNPTTITKAKDFIWNAIIGLIIIISSVLILKTINPNLIDMNLNISEIKIQPAPELTKSETWQGTYACVDYVTGEWGENIDCSGSSQQECADNCQQESSLCVPAGGIVRGCTIIGMQGGSPGGGGGSLEF